MREISGRHGRLFNRFRGTTILKAVGSEWKVHYVLAGSGGWDQDVRPDDEVLSINGVNVPSTSSTIAQLDSFSSSVASARSGGVDVYLVERGGTQSTKSLSLGSFAMLKRKSNGYRIGVVAYALVAKLLHEGSSGARCFVCENDVYGGSNVYGSGCKKVDGGWIVCIEMLTLPDGFDPEGGEENAGSIMCQTDGPPTCFPPGVNMP